jgi:tetratricopeptide (TPR) repeat protein
MDALERGIGFYQKGYEANYRKAAEWFERALAADPHFSQTALYLARAYHALYAYEKAEKHFRNAIEIDPDYREARASFGGMLLDIGDVDEAIRQFQFVLQREPEHAVALTNLAQAYRMKELYAQAIEAARKAIRLSPEYAEPHLWLAESLRLSGQYERSVAEYDAYLRLSAVESNLGGRLNYYVMGFLTGLGKKKRAAQQDIWKDLQSLAYFGMCDCERKESRFERAIEYCRKALLYDPSDPYAHYALGLSFLHEANRTGDTDNLEAAAKHFRTTVKINPHLTESDLARQNLANIQAAQRSR